MALIRDTANDAYSDGATSNPDTPFKDKIRRLFGLVEDTINGLPQGYQVSYETRAELYGDLNWPAGAIGRVFGDSNTAYRGVYLKIGSSGSGSWTRIGPLPGGDTSALQAQLDQEIEDREAAILALIGGAPSSRDTLKELSDLIDNRAPMGLGSVAGTNTITATAGIVSYQIGQAFWLTPVATNTGAATLNLDSLGAKELTRADGTPLIAGDLVAGTVYLLRASGAGVSSIRVIGTPSSIIADLLAFREDQDAAHSLDAGMDIVAQNLWVFHALANGVATFAYDREVGAYLLPLIGDDQNDAAGLLDLGYRYGGDGLWPLLIDTSGGLILGYDLFTGSLVGAATGDNVVIAGGASEPYIMGYISGGALRAVGGTGEDRLINNDAGLTWHSVQSVGGSLQAIMEADGAKLVRRVAQNGNLFFDGQITLVLSYGQSNGEGQARSDGVANLFPVNPYSGHLLMPATAAANVWLGQATTGGASIELLPEEVFGITDLVGSIADTGTHGTTAIEGFAHAYMKKASDECYGYLPDLLIWNGSEGGQSISSLMNDAPAGYYGFDNVVTTLTRLMQFKPAGKRLVFGWIEMSQGEANTSDPALGSKHELVRSQIEAAVQPITGQTTPVRMITWQMSNFVASVGARSILDYALSISEPFGAFWCGGPTYCYPLSDDFLHHTSVGHRMRGELMAVIVDWLERGREWKPLHIVSASITGANQITAVLSQAATIATNDVVTAIANAGIAVPGKTVTGVSISGGTNLIITTSEPAAGAATVTSGLNPQSDPKNVENVPRTNIRSTVSYGTYFEGTPMHMWLTHRQIEIS